MIFGIGTDIIEIKRIEKAIESESFIKKIYTEEEIEYLKEKNYSSETASGIFCKMRSAPAPLHVRASKDALNPAHSRDSRRTKYTRVCSAAFCEASVHAAQRSHAHRMWTADRATKDFPE